MKIELRASTGNLKTLNEMLYFSQVCGRHCYSEKDWAELEKEPYKKDFVEGLIKNGHHSVFEHVNLTFSMTGIPKILAMVLNNERQYATSEKSARYTQMQSTGMQKEIYDKWMGIFQAEISEKHKEKEFGLLFAPDSRGQTRALKLAQENARYMTSVFTPTKMVHSLNLRQLNCVAGYMEEFVDKDGERNLFNRRLANFLQEFLKEVSEFRIEGLKSQSDRHLSFFGGAGAEEHFGDVYSANYWMSFACLGQAHRHRTISYSVANDVEPGVAGGFFVPKLIRGTKFGEEWLSDLYEVAKDDFPQAQLVRVNERGKLEDFRSKLILRLCGHAQHEIMERTLRLAKTYADRFKGFDSDWLKPKCQQGFVCNERCAFGGMMALERLV